MDKPKTFIEPLEDTLGFPKSRTRVNLEHLGCRLEGNFTLHSGGFSSVKWDIEKLFDYPPWVIEHAISDWIFQVGKLSPDILQGIPKGGSKLAEFLKPIRKSVV